MEDSDDKRDDEIIKKPETMEEAHRMLEMIESLQNNLNISSSDGAMSGDIDMGFIYANRAGGDQPEGPEGPEGPERPEQ